MGIELDLKRLVETGGGEEGEGVFWTEEGGGQTGKGTSRLGVLSVWAQKSVRQSETHGWPNTLS